MKLYANITFMCLFGALLVGQAPGGSSYTLKSPDGKVTVQIDYQVQLKYSVRYQDQDIIADCPISMSLSGGTVLGRQCQLSDLKEREIQETITPVVPEKRSRIINHGREVSLLFKGDYGVIFRAYNDGVAYRFITEFEEPVTIVSEQATFRFVDDFYLFHPEPQEGFMGSCEKPYVYEKISEFPPGMLSFMPVLVEIPGGVKVAITEADLTDYAGLWLTRHGEHETTLTGMFPPYPAKEKPEGGRYIVVEEPADYIARTRGNRSFPWRIIAMAVRDGDLIETDIVFRLSDAQVLEDTSWIRPGKVAWDWWNALNIWGVDFEAGINTATYKYYIDFASENNIEYIILDAGWSDEHDLLKINPDINLAELIRYGNEKNVGLILWCVWHAMDKQMDKVMPIYEKWGIKGVKVDFMDRDDQKVVQFYHRCVKTAARYHLLVDMHGAYKPAGLRRMYPNLVTREGVMGLEYNKWSNLADPEYAVTAPFIRMLAGPMDYTPGAMNNAQRDNFRIIHTRPMSQGTRAHQMAEYVVFESPLQMLSDTPTSYRENPGCLSFLSRVPTVWDETIALDAKVADYVLAARRKGQDWYVGAMTDWSSREITIDFSFLGKGKGKGNYNADIIADGPNAHKIGIDHKHETRQVTSNTRLTVKLAPGGGWVARITPVK
ncbi:MAG: glycoside hydrolase family 97 protein [Sedimentisphaerales bacterium]|nr:glycoside hydrolase family 97 protein [Sedimentisphaerales bacterium]